MDEILMIDAQELANEINARGRYGALVHDHVVTVVKLPSMRPCPTCGGAGHLIDGTDAIVTIYDKVLFDPDRQTVTFGNGSDVGTTDVTTWLDSLHR